MGWELVFWILCFLASFGLVFFIFNQLLYLTDLEADAVSIFDATVSINRWTLLEYALQGSLSAVFLFTGRWIMFLLSAPISGYHLALFLRRQHLIDVTEVFRSINFEKKFRMFKLIYYLVFVVILMFRIVAGILSLFDSEGLDMRSPLLEF